MPATEKQRASARKASEASKAAAQRRKEAAAAGAAPFQSPPEPPTPEPSVADAIQFDPEKVLRYALNAPHDALAVLTGRDAFRLSKTEEAVASTTVATSLELVGWTRFVIYLAPIAAVCVLLAIEGARFRMFSEWIGERRIERDIKRAADEEAGFVQSFEDEVQPARQARAAATGTRGLSPTELTYLEEEEAG